MNKSLIWDLPTRLFHWLLVASILAQYATVEWLESAVQWHFYIGYFTLYLIVFRVLWGIVGTEHAKFANFIHGPSAVFQYLKTLFNKHSRPAIGHNPLGGWFVIVMLILIAVQAISGLYMTDDIFLDGPYRGMVDEDTLNIMNAVHHIAFDILLYVIGLHILAILFYAVYKKQKLVPPMVHGHKETNEAGIAHSKIGTAILIALLSAAIVYIAIEVYPPSPSTGGYYYY